MPKQESLENRWHSQNHDGILVRFLAHTFYQFRPDLFPFLFRKFSSFSGFGFFEETEEDIIYNVGFFPRILGLPAFLRDLLPLAAVGHQRLGNKLRYV
ncbi:MAG: hypothetical protein EHM38_00465 [Geobacteraceae bacterium]|nr:MAG: hypothetical protein EHM38_00465 [Geobacteraceae bacterium]